MNVCILTGTFAKYAAHIESKPALGVMEWTILGFSFLKRRYNWMRATKSFSGEICLCIGTEKVVTFSLSRRFAKCMSSPDTAIISKYLLKNDNCPARNEFIERATVEERIILSFITFNPCK